jgi:hypothetical protein
VLTRCQLHVFSIGVALDTGASKVVPTITVQDSDTQTEDKDKGKGKQQHQAQKSPANGRPVEDDTPAPPGAMPGGHAPPIPDWYKVGWRSVSGIDGPPLAEGEETDKGVLDLFLEEQFYGDWYHNAGLIVVVSSLPLRVEYLVLIFVSPSSSYSRPIF